jgi:glyoxylase-like metal-dependent hydrolase (beta-lactamase superfamily II)
MDAPDFKTKMTFDYDVGAELLPGVVRLVANNPGPFTFKGTNTYLIGRRTLAVIDPGPADDLHLAAILRAADGREITHIISTHAHRDHVDGIPALKAATGAKLCAMRRAPGMIIPLDRAPQGREFVDFDLAPDIALSGTETLEGSDWALTTIHTPGHAPDHLCFKHAESGALFSGDHVMAWNTSVVAPPEGRMSDYMRSLELLLGDDASVYLPGHGGRVEEPRRTLKAYLLHRRMREQGIVKAIKDGAKSAREVLPLVYPDIADQLIPAALLTVLAHVEMLAEKGEIEAGDLLSVDAPLRAV